MTRMLPPLEPSLPTTVEELSASVNAWTGELVVELLLQPPTAGLPDRWYVSDGTRMVGPVDYELLARGVQAGAVGAHCWLRNEAWRVWRRVAEFARPAPRPRACVPTGFEEEERTLVDLAPRGGGPSFETILSAAIARMAAEACLVIEVGDQGGVVRAARGAGSLDVLGEYVPVSDPVLVAAAGGALVLAEPRPGVVGAALLARLARAGSPPTAAGALMVPVFSRGPRPHLSGVLEIGRTSAFHASDVGEALALAGRAAEVFDALPATVARSVN